MASDAEVAWLAGLLEGEGSFMLGRNRTGGKTYLYPRIVVTMTDRDVIARVAGLFGTAVYDVPTKLPNRKSAFRAQVNGSHAAEWMTCLHPWLGDRRRAKVDEVLAAYGDIESTAVRRARSCSEAARARWAVFGTREGSLRGL